MQGSEVYGLRSMVCVLSCVAVFVCSSTTCKFVSKQRLSEESAGQTLHLLQRLFELALTGCANVRRCSASSIAERRGARREGGAAAAVQDVGALFFVVVFTLLPMRSRALIEPSFRYCEPVNQRARLCCLEVSAAAQHELPERRYSSRGARSISGPASSAAAQFRRRSVACRPLQHASSSGP